MKEKVEKIRNDIKTVVTNQSDEVTICLLRIIELMEEKDGRPETDTKRKPGRPKRK